MTVYQPHQPQRARSDQIGPHRITCGRSDGEDAFCSSFSFFLQIGFRRKFKTPQGSVHSLGWRSRLGGGFCRETRRGSIALCRQQHNRTALFTFKSQSASLSTCKDSFPRKLSRKNFIISMYEVFLLIRKLAFAADITAMLK